MHLAPPVQAGTDLLREGESTDQLQFVSEGWACRYKTTRDGTRQIVALLVPGDPANLDSLVFGHLDYGVRALTVIKVLTVPRDRLLALAERHGGIAKSLSWLALSENAILSQWALCLGRLSAKQRLAHLFCELCVRLGRDDKDENGEVSFRLPLTQEQIADALGLTAVHINRTIQQLRRDRLVEVRPRSVTITDLDALCRIASFDPAYLHRNDLVAARADGSAHHFERPVLGHNL